MSLKDGFLQTFGSGALFILWGKGDKMSNKIERIFSHDHDFDFECAIKLVIAHKIEELVNNGNKVNTATSQSIKKGIEDT